MAEPAVADLYVDTLVTFGLFGLDLRLLEATEKLGFAHPTLIQAKAIPLAIDERRDIIAKALTGLGKTAAYAVPIVNAVLQKGAAGAVQAVMLVPTRELAAQVAKFVEQLGVFANGAVTVANLSAGHTSAVVKLVLLTMPAVVVATPAKLREVLEEMGTDAPDLQQVHLLAVDEVDLMVLYGYMDDLTALAEYLPVKKHALQVYLMSATINDDVEALKNQLCTKPAVLKLNDGHALERKLVQYYAMTSEFDKFLLLYVVFKLGLIKGKLLVFVNLIDRGYRLKLFLEQFGVRCCILNLELPINLRLHIVDEFNKNVYHLLIATDDGNEDGKGDKEYGVSRGVDFRNVACVLNFDFPLLLRAYIHRIGRTARAGKLGMALLFVVPGAEVGKHKTAGVATAKRDEKILERVTKAQARLGFEVKPYVFDKGQVEAFRYRAEDGFRAVTAVAVREARVRELRTELIHSDKLKRHFEENPQDLALLRHDKELHPSKVQPHLKRVPDYLLPEGAQAGKMDVGFVPFHKKKRGRVAKKKNTRGKTNPLKSFKARR